MLPCHGDAHLISEGSGGISAAKNRESHSAGPCFKAKDHPLDEATSALDNITQKHVATSLASLGCTRVVIAHRLSTVKECDRILVMDGGRIVEEGSYEELMARKGLFYELAARQITRSRAMIFDFCKLPGVGRRCERLSPVMAMAIVIVPLAYPCRLRAGREAADTEIYIPILADAAWLLADGSFYNGASLARGRPMQLTPRRDLPLRQSWLTTVPYEKGVEMATGWRDPAVTAVLNLQNFDVSKTTAGILAESGKGALSYGAYDSLYRGQPLPLRRPRLFRPGKAMAVHAVEKGRQASRSTTTGFNPRKSW